MCQTLQFNASHSWNIGKCHWAVAQALVKHPMIVVLMSSFGSIFVIDRLFHFHAFFVLFWIETIVHVDKDFPINPLKVAASSKKHISLPKWFLDLRKLPCFTRSPCHLLCDQLHAPVSWSSVLLWESKKLLVGDLWFLPLIHFFKWKLPQVANWFFLETLMWMWEQWQCITVTEDWTSFLMSINAVVKASDWQFNPTCEAWKEKWTLIKSTIQFLLNGCDVHWFFSGKLFMWFLDFGTICWWGKGFTVTALPWSSLMNVCGKSFDIPMLCVNDVSTVSVGVATLFPVLSCCDMWPFWIGWWNLLQFCLFGSGGENIPFQVCNQLCKKLSCQSLFLSFEQTSNFCFIHSLCSVNFLV